METRIEIFKDNSWRQLRLTGKEEVRYNSLINSVGNVSTREISHTNTFSLRPIYQNIDTLGINFFNPSKLAKALNSKYKAKYYVEDKLLQAGYVVINNTKGGEINVNFIDESLSLTDKWGTISFKELIQGNFPFPSDYATAIDALRDYDMTKLGTLTVLPEVGTRGHRLALFPNNLNTIGDKFQTDLNGDRLTNGFNPYQSRPIFSTKALFDMATEGFGYTPIYDASVDWDTVAKTYIVNKGQDENKEGSNALITTQHASIGGSSHYYNVGTNLNTYDWISKSMFIYPLSVSTQPDDVPNFVSVETLGDDSWKTQNSIFVPDLSTSSVGNIIWEANVTGVAQNDPYQIEVKIVWRNTSGLNDPTTRTVKYSKLGIEPTSPYIVYNNAGSGIMKVTMDKTIFNTPPPSETILGDIHEWNELVGVLVNIGTGNGEQWAGILGDMRVSETRFPEGVVAFDEYGQYIPTAVDLSHNAPTKTIKELLVSSMHKEGILMSINATDKTVKFFSYGHYETQRDNGDFNTWTNYLQKYNAPNFNTDYGNNFAKVNRIGLSSPFQGNTLDITMENQGVDSKYKDFTEDYVKSFNDVSNVVEVLSPVAHFEYTHKGFGIVENEGVLSNVTQLQADGPSFGLLTIPKLANINYAVLPSGVSEWYKLVDGAVKADAKFLIPVAVMRLLDLSMPIYVEELGGFYIIEKIEEYINSQTIVNVKLIKLIDNLITE